MRKFDHFGRTVVIPIASTEPIVIDRVGNELQVVFPPTEPGPTTATLANGAVVDVFQLGQVVSQFCPGFSGSFCSCN